MAGKRPHPVLSTGEEGQPADEIAPKPIAKPGRFHPPPSSVFNAPPYHGGNREAQENKRSGATHCEALNTSPNRNDAVYYGSDGQPIDSYAKPKERNSSMKFQPTSGRCCTLLRGFTTFFGRYRGCCCFSLSTFVLCLAVYGVLDGVFMITSGLARKEIGTLSVALATTVHSDFGQFVHDVNVLSDEGPGSIIYKHVGGDRSEVVIGTADLYRLLVGLLVVLLSVTVIIGVLYRLERLLGLVVFFLVVTFLARVFREVSLWIFAGTFHWTTLLTSIVTFALRGIQVDALFSLVKIMRQGGSGFEHQSAVDLALAEEKEPLTESLIDSGIVKFDVFGEI
eukprot:GHVN01063569.1.p1 GENE.GHVN01063569.1~~GHVN01063569.1.p1  ORF type:complete len:338 (+),score=16.35 GHVN01063569.1:200-1213(+)